MAFANCLPTYSPFISVPRRSVARRSCVVVASLRAQQPNVLNDVTAIPSDGSTVLSRRRALQAIGVAVASGALLATAAPFPVFAKEQEAINDPAELKAQFESQYQQWASGQFDTWLASQPDTLKWQSSYNGVPLKFKGKAGAKQYFTLLNADLDIQSYRALAIFVDNDGDEATVVVEAKGTSRRTQQPFSTVFLHKYAVGPMGQILSFKETTDTALLAQLAPPAPPQPPQPAKEAPALDASVEPGSSAKSA